MLNPPNFQKCSLVIPPDALRQPNQRGHRRNRREQRSLRYTELILQNADQSRLKSRIAENGNNDR